MKNITTSWKRHAVRAALPLIVGTAALLPASTAQAAGGWGTIPYGGYQRSCAYLSCPTTAWVPAGSSVWVNCWVDAGWANGTNRWFSTSYLGHGGFMSASVMYPQPTVPHC